MNKVVLSVANVYPHVAETTSEHVTHQWKIFAPQISVNIRNTYLRPLQKVF